MSLELLDKTKTKPELSQQEIILEDNGYFKQGSDGTGNQCFVHSLGTIEKQNSKFAVPVDVAQTYVKDLFNDATEELKKIETSLGAEVTLDHFLSITRQVINGLKGIDAEFLANKITEDHLDPIKNYVKTSLKDQNIPIADVDIDRYFDIVDKIDKQGENFFNYIYRIFGIKECLDGCIDKYIDEQLTGFRANLKANRDYARKPEIKGDEFITVMATTLANLEKITYFDTQKDKQELSNLLAKFTEDVTFTREFTVSKFSTKKEADIAKFIQLYNETLNFLTKTRKPLESYDSMFNETITAESIITRLNGITFTNPTKAGENERNKLALIERYKEFKDLTLDYKHNNLIEDARCKILNIEGKLKAVNRVEDAEFFFKKNTSFYDLTVAYLAAYKEKRKIFVFNTNDTQAHWYTPNVISYIEKNVQFQGKSLNEMIFNDDGDDCDIVIENQGGYHYDRYITKKEKNRELAKSSRLKESRKLKKTKKPTTAYINSSAGDEEETTTVEGFKGFINNLFAYKKEEEKKELADFLNSDLEHIFLDDNSEGKGFINDPITKENVAVVSDIMQSIKDGDLILRGKHNKILKISAKTENEKIIYNIQFYDGIQEMKAAKKVRVIIFASGYSKVQEYHNSFIQDITKKGYDVDVVSYDLKVPKKTQDDLKINGKDVKITRIQKDLNTITDDEINKIQEDQNKYVHTLLIDGHGDGTPAKATKDLVKKFQNSGLEGTLTPIAWCTCCMPTQRLDCMLEFSYKTDTADIKLNSLLVELQENNAFRDKLGLSKLEFERDKLENSIKNILHYDFSNEAVSALIIKHCPDPLKEKVLRGYENATNPTKNPTIAECIVNSYKNIGGMYDDTDSLTDGVNMKMLFQLWPETEEVKYIKNLFENQKDFFRWDDFPKKIVEDLPFENQKDKNLMLVTPDILVNQIETSKLREQRSNILCSEEEISYDEDFFDKIFLKNLSDDALTTTIAALVNNKHDVESFMNFLLTQDLQSITNGDKAKIDAIKRFWDEYIEHADIIKLSLNDDNKDILDDVNNMFDNLQEKAPEPKQQSIIFEAPENTTEVFKILTSDENLEIGTATLTWKEKYEQEAQENAISEILNNIDSDKIDYVKAILKSINEFRNRDEWQELYDEQIVLQCTKRYEDGIPDIFEPRVGFKQMYENETFKSILFANMITEFLIESTDSIDDAKDMLFKASASVQQACDKAGLGTKFGRVFKGKNTKNSAGRLMNSARFAKLVETVGFDLDSFGQSKSFIV